MSINNGFYILQVVTLYWIVSISMVYLNKVILSAYDSTIPAPIFVTWFQCAITCLICIVFGEIGERSRQKGGGSYFDSYPIVKYNVASGVSVMPLSIVFVGMIALNNLCLKYVEVSFYNVARSLSIVFNVLFTFIILGERTSILTCSTLVIVLYGFYIGIEGEVNFSLFGTVAGVLASVFVSLNSIFTAKVLPKVQNDKSLLLYYNNVNALVLFAPLIIAFEYQILADNILKFFDPIFWAVMTLTGCMGFAIGLVTVMQVKATSPLTHNISGTAKAAFQSALAFYLWGNPYTLKGLLGIALVLMGSALYTYVQMRAMTPSNK